MLLVEHFFGFSFLIFALFCLTSYNNEFKRWRVPLFYNRLQQMRERWGVVPGTILHIMAYVLTPMGFGLLFLMGLVY
jgi:hypothetical protein